MCHCELNAQCKFTSNFRNLNLCSTPSPPLLAPCFLPQLLYFLLRAASKSSPPNTLSTSMHALKEGTSDRKNKCKNVERSGQTDRKHFQLFEGPFSCSLGGIKRYVCCQWSLSASYFGPSACLAYLEEYSQHLELKRIQVSGKAPDIFCFFLLLSSQIN